MRTAATTTATQCIALPNGEGMLVTGQGPAVQVRDWGGRSKWFTVTMVRVGADGTCYFSGYRYQPRKRCSVGQRPTMFNARRVTKVVAR